MRMPGPVKMKRAMRKKATRKRVGRERVQVIKVAMIKTAEKGALMKLKSKRNCRRLSTQSLWNSTEMTFFGNFNNYEKFTTRNT